MKVSKVIGPSLIILSMISLLSIVYMILYIMQISCRLNTEFVEILSIFDPVKISIIKSILENEGINYYLKGEHSYLMEPMLEPVRLMVRKDQVEMIKEILDLER